MNSIPDIKMSNIVLFSGGRIPIEIEDVTFNLNPDIIFKI